MAQTRCRHTKNVYLCDSEMQRVIPAIRIHFLRQQSVGLHHDQGVTSLHAEQEVVVVQIATDVGELKRTLHHAARGVAIVAKDSGRETAVVGADSHSSVESLALLYQRLKHLHIVQRYCSLHLSTDHRECWVSLGANNRATLVDLRAPTIVH